MPITLEFLAPDQPALPAAADYLLQRYRRGAHADLRSAIVVLPSSRAGRRLLEILVQRCDEQHWLLAPPVIETVGKLPEQLYTPQRPFASTLTQRLAWSETLRSAPRAELLKVVPFPPADDQRMQWMKLGDLLRGQYLELAGDGLTFEDVALRGKSTPGFAEGERWLALHQLQQAYLRRLDDLQLWDLQTARLFAVRKRECTTELDIILIATVDMNVTLRNMLDLVAQRVTALVYAPPSWRDRFDPHGCLAPDQWTDVEIPIETQQVVIAEDPSDQAQRVVAELSRLEGKYRADEIVIGLPDETLLPEIQRALAQENVESRFGPGQTLSQSPPFQLLRTVARYLDQAYFVDFAALVRHVDLGRWLSSTGIAGDVLVELDRHYNDFLPYRLTEASFEPLPAGSVLVESWRRIEQLVDPLRQPPRRLSSWSDLLFEMLATVYGERVFDRQDSGDRLVWSALEHARELLTSYAAVPETLMPSVAAREAIQWLLDESQAATTPEPANREAIELLGWLEMPLDDAPVAMITSFNEGLVPSSVNSDLFLPNTLRQRLGMLDNNRRYARDAYAVSVLGGWRDRLTFIVGQRNRDGDPMTPSRLLFATDGETAARRALSFFRPHHEPTAALNAQRPASRSQGHRLVVPKPLPLSTPITSMSVTSFRDYLACPYRFYLRHVLKLTTLDDRSQEMDGRAFGNLAHDVLSAFGTSPHANSTDADEIASFLNVTLNKLSRRRYGQSALPAVLVQVEQLRIRLRAFAAFQAERAQQGWQIEHIEVPDSQHTATLVVDRRPMQLTGRIDRIDYRPSTGERIIWDYKTSDRGDTPQQTHRSGMDWIDLQLPLYRHLASVLGIAGQVQLGYIMLPKDTEATAWCVAPWSDTELAVADETAREVVRCIRAEKFWPPASEPPSFSDDFAAICQDKVLGGAILAE